MLKILPSPSLHLGFHREFPTTSWQRKRRLQSGLQLGSAGWKAPPAGGLLEHYSDLWDPAEGQCGEKSSPWAELQAGLLVIHFASGEKQPGVQLPYWFTLWFMLDWLVRDLERTRLENMWQRNLGKSYVEWLWMGRKMKMFVSFVNTYQKVNSAGKNFNNQVIRMIHFVDTSCPLFPATSVITQ